MSLPCPRTDGRRRRRKKLEENEEEVVDGRRCFECCCWRNRPVKVTAQRCNGEAAALLASGGCKGRWVATRKREIVIKASKSLSQNGFTIMA